jgi:ATP-dependent helicase Lhr and Lhr-like helicase
MADNEKASSSFPLLDERIQRWIWTQRWNELRDIQEQAIPRILAADADVILAAATAGGKTEAAFLPILTALLQRPGADGLVIYISPLKALINDQWHRLSSLCETLEIAVHPWHGDIGVAKKREFLKHPAGVVLITPESLESLFVNRGHGIESMLSTLMYVVVDELHAFMGAERGKQLQSLLHRLDVAAGRKLPRIGLSATLGDMQLAADFLRPGAGDLRNVIESAEGGQELKMIIKGYVRPTTLDVDQPADSDPPESLADAAEAAVGDDIFKNLRGQNNLIFPNSRRNVELYADLLRRRCEALGVPNEFWPHHGSLSKEIREETEAALKSGERPASAVCTTTLELGIDIGTVRSVAQIGPPPSVASLRQRLGRSGRRGEAAILRSYCIEDALDSKSSLSDQLRECLVQTIALTRLLISRWYEPPRTGGLHLSTLVQQLLSLIAQYGGISAERAWSMLCNEGAFPAVNRQAFVELLRGLGQQDVIVQSADGSLLHGGLGEKLVNHYSFYAAFQSEREYRIVTESQTLGSLPVSRPLAEGSYVIFAGRRWRVVSVNDHDAVITVAPAPAGRPPIFDGSAGVVHGHVRRTMRDVYDDSGVADPLDATARTLLGEARQNYDRLGLDRRAIIAVGANVHLFPWDGDVVHDTLALLLSLRGLRAENEGLSVTVFGVGPGPVADALEELAAQPEPDNEALAASVKNKIREKWDGLLPDRLRCAGFASSALDVDAARVACTALVSTFRPDVTP